MSKTAQYAIIGGVGLVVLGGIAYALSGGSKSSSSLISNASNMFSPNTSNESSGSSYINPVSPTQTPPKESPFTRSADWVTNVGGSRKRKRRQSRKRKMYTKRRK